MRMHAASVLRCRPDTLLGCCRLLTAPPTHGAPYSLPQCLYPSRPHRDTTARPLHHVMLALRRDMRVEYVIGIVFSLDM